MRRTAKHEEEVNSGPVRKGRHRNKKVFIPVTFEKDASKNRRTEYVLWHEGYRFVRSKRTDVMEYWMCEVTGCPAKARTPVGEFNGTMRHEHNHDASGRERKPENQPVGWSKNRRRKRSQLPAPLPANSSTNSHEAPSLDDALVSLLSAVPSSSTNGINGIDFDQLSDMSENDLELGERMDLPTTSAAASSDAGQANDTVTSEVYGGFPRRFSMKIADDDMTPELFVDLLAQFYRLGWVHGSSGGMACCSQSTVLYSPSSVQKERLRPDDLFVFNADDSKLVARPADPAIRESACTPVFSLILNHTGAICTIHTHSKYSNLLTQLLAGRDRLELSDQEMIKGVLNRRTGHNYANFERLVVPIIENCPQEFQLIPALKQVLDDYPETCGILVRNHGFFVWGPTWQRTKIMLECYEYLFELACEMIRHNLPLDK